MLAGRRVLLCLAVLVLDTSMVRAQMKYEGIKFWVYRTEQPGTNRLWRVGLKDGTHLYTIDKREVDRLVSTKKGAIETMDAFVSTKPAERLIPLRRFTLTTPSGAVRHFYTAYPPEARDVGAKPDSKEFKMAAFVFPHDYKPSAEQSKQVVPVYWFYNATSGEHFYTTAEKERADLIRQTLVVRQQAKINNSTI
jgi:Repeat of unknown function (DUF5648)